MASPEADKAARVEAIVALIEARSQKSERASLTTFARGYFERVNTSNTIVNNTVINNYASAKAVRPRFACSIPAPANTAGPRATQ